MATIRFDIDKINDITNFNLWQVQITRILIQGDLEKVLIEKKLKDMNKSEQDRLDKKVLSRIQLCLTNNVLQEVLMEKTTFTLWKMLETLYVKKSLTNRLVLKQWLCMFRMNEGKPVL
ncbi:hypothetical protein PVK06_008400 [Gossypium arboreum]|uniref:Retrovirus-related Pol polyprotein from transposon TNT 1-94 n=1 Tax=Gossypium arboreum TaxID=29729 RepID=A0ABR0QJU5_GOSAR|nr:hypothetical protein PVK06_008400 [Gossypium arboreum]